MQIGKLNLSALTPPVIGSKGEQNSAAAADPSRAGAAEGAESNSAQVASYRQILSKYDVTHITPSQFTQLLRELHSAGAISDEELRELAGVRHELDRAEVESDEPVNLLELFATRLEKLVESANNKATDREVSSASPADHQQAITLAERQLEWLKKFATLHADTEQEGLNTLA